MGTNGNGNGHAHRFDLEYKLTGSVMPREDYWVAYNNEFEITTYGHSAEVAQDRMLRAIELMLDRLRLRGADAVRARMTELGVAFLLEPTGARRVRRFGRDRVERYGYGCAGR